MSLRQILRTASYEPFGLQFYKTLISMITSDLDRSKSLSEDGFIINGLHMLNALCQIYPDTLMGFVKELGAFLKVLGFESTWPYFEVILFIHFVLEDANRFWEISEGNIR